VGHFAAERVSDPEISESVTAGGEMATIESVGRKPAKLSPEFRRSLRRVARRRAQAERDFRDVVLSGMASGESIAAMAREIDPTGETVDRKLLWAWIQAWTKDGDG
jgi:hypothetical protein